MSIIIRLQNLPLNANSGDIRKFFGGLRIPDGGVDILGGDKGNAFIAFMSDEDGRIAMRKDGWKLKDSRVNLFLSSHMEMQHEVEKLTKSSLVDAPSSKTSSKSHSSGDEIIRGRSSEKRPHSPHNYRDWSIDKSRTVNEYRQRSRSPVGERDYSSKRSPRRKSRSPKRYITSHLSAPSEEYRSAKQEKKSLSPEVGSRNAFVHEVESDSKSSGQQSVSQSELQAKLERCITEELEKSDFDSRMIITGNKPPDWNVGGFNMNVKEDFPFNSHQPYQQSYTYGCEPQSLMPFQPPYDAERQFEGNNFNPGFSAEGSKSGHGVSRPMRTTYFVLLSDLDPQWNYKKVQTILKGFFAPQGHIRFENDRDGLKTGRAVVKVANQEDYENILKIGEVTIDGLKIKLSKCKFALLKKLFRRDVSKHRNLMPFQPPYDAERQFEGNNSDPTFSAEGSFNNSSFNSSYLNSPSCNSPSFASDSFASDSFASDSFAGPSFNSPPFNSPSFNSPSFNSPSFNSPSFNCPEKKLPMTGRPCVMLTGLPLHTTPKRICLFFSKSNLNPVAIHMTIKKKFKRKLSDGRAFVEFSNFLDLDSALKFDGEKLGKCKIISVKPVLFDEMVKILDAQKASRVHHYSSKPAPALPAVIAVPALTVPERVP